MPPPGKKKAEKLKQSKRSSGRERFIAKSSKPPKKESKPYVPRGGGSDVMPISKPVTPTPIRSGVDPKLAAAVGRGSAIPGGTPTQIGHGPGLVDPALAAAARIGPAAGGFPGTTLGAGVGVGGTGGISDVQDLFPILGETPPPPDDETPPPDDDDGKDGEGDGEEEKKFFVKDVGMVNKRLYDYYQNLSKKMEHEEAIKRVKLKQIEDEWAEKNLVDLMSGEGIKRLVTKDFGASKAYENKFLGSAGAANILNQLDKIKGRDDAETAQLKQAYVNRIIEANPEGASKMFGIDLQYGNITPESFEKTLVSSNQGNKNFDKNYHETAGAYWDVNTPQTSGDLDDMATAYQQGNLKMTKANTLAIQQAVEQKRGSTRPWDYDVGGGQQTDPTDTTDPTDPNKPYGNLTFDVYGRPIKKYDYTGGPEQLYLGGGWKKDDKYIGSPWGTHHFKSGGIANFKPYGY